jgi:hypothetical protein
MRSSQPEELRDMIDRGAGLLNRTTTAAAPLAKGAATMKR